MPLTEYRRAAVRAFIAAALVGALVGGLRELVHPTHQP